MIKALLSFKVFMQLGVFVCVTCLRFF